jgi:hypothetical protein
LATGTPTTTTRVVFAIALLTAVALINFAAMPGEFWGGDPIAWREETRSILLRGELNIPEDFGVAFGERGQFYVKHPRSGLYYSKFGFMNALMNLPPMWVQKRFNVGLGGSAMIAQTGQKPSLLLVNLWNIVLSVGLAGVLWVISGWYTNRLFTRAFFVLSCLYCTFFTYYQRAQSSEIYQALFFAAYFACLMPYLRGAARGGSTIWLALTWLFVATLLFTRVLYGLLLPLTVVLSLYTILRTRSRHDWQPALLRAAPMLVIPPALILVALGYLNYVRFGSPWLSGYHAWKPEQHLPVGRWQDGVWGLLFAARFSIFLYFPPLIFALLAVRRFARQYTLDAIVILSIFIVFLFVIGKIPTWAGEWTYGPRYVLFVLPMLALPFILFVDQLIDERNRWSARAWTALIVVSFAYSTYLQIQVNRLPFWIYYQARAPLEAVTTDAIQAYFRDHHVGIIASDLLRHADDMENLPWWKDVDRLVAPQSLNYYRAQLHQLIKNGNWYWSLPPEQRG